jgi:hypothetical protein
MSTVRDPHQLTPGAVAFLEGRRDTLTSANVDPLNAEAYARYERAMSLKASGELAAAAALLELSCSPPSIYKGHYRELFKIWRQMNRTAVSAGDYGVVIARVRSMAQMDDELVRAMLDHWSKVQKRVLPENYFDNDRNLLVSDAKTLRKAAMGCGDEKAIDLANTLIAGFRTVSHG